MELDVQPALLLCTAQPLYNTVHYKMVSDITLIRAGPQKWSFETDFPVLLLQFTLFK